MTASQLRADKIIAAALALPHSESPRVIAIDGRAASGKTTLASLVAAGLGAGLVHMDDFFLPPALRTEARLAEPGGNVHYERFAEEVLPNLARRGEFSYTRFDCGIMDFCGKVNVSDSRFRVVEGSYSLHPAFGGYADLAVFSDVAPDEQLRRILARDGAELLEMFRTRWIPMEELYFNVYDVRGRADLTV